MRVSVVAFFAVLSFCAAPVARAATWLIPPVDAAIARRFEPPGFEWGPGHRGIDYAVTSGTAVRAVADGTVTFAGPVAGTIAVTIAHADGISSTYSDLASIEVEPGDRISQGTWIGRTGRAHPGTPGLHLGIKVDGEYADPEGFMGPLDTTTAIRLAPLVWEPPATLPASFRAPLLSANSSPECEPVAPLSGAAPNDNVAVLVAGIGSKTRGGVSAELYEGGGRLLGYRPSDTYLFSYRGTAGRSLHEPYERADTFADIRVAARRLQRLLARIAVEQPGRRVDLIAHSQGGIVARTYLQLLATAWDDRAAPVDHLVTFSSPHEGAPLAGAREVLDDVPVGRALMMAGRWWSRNGGPLPDPYAPSIEQLSPGSELLQRLDSEAVLFGTRVLSLGIANDAVVPADRSGWRRYPTHVVGPEGLNGHDRVVTSDIARSIAKAFLRDGPATCRGGWDLWGPRVGGVISTAERALPWLLRF